eukprot:4411581-Amphidinium_carterae.1
MKGGIHSRKLLAFSNGLMLNDIARRRRTFCHQSHARGIWPFAAKFSAAFQHPIDGSNIGFLCELVSRSDICGWRWHMMKGKECMDATLEHLVWLVYPKFAHYTFTIAAFRIVKARFIGSGMTLRDSYVLLKFSWLVVALFGPCLPVLNTLIALLEHIYSILLFRTTKNGISLPFILDMKKIDDEEHGPSLPSAGFST